MFKAYAQAENSNYESGGHARNVPKNMKRKDINACSFDVLHEYSWDVFGTISYVYLSLVFIAIIPRMYPWNIHVLYLSLIHI